MAETGVQVFMPKEKADQLKAKYNLTDETIQDVVSNLKVAETPEATEPEKEESEPEIFAKIGKGETSIGDAMVLIDFYDRREARRKLGQNNITPDQIAKAVTDGIKETFGTKPRTEDEMPQWAKTLQDDIKEIKSREQKKEEETRLQQTVQNIVEPVKQDLQKTKEDLVKTKEALEQPKQPDKGELETTRDTLKNLKEIDELRGKGEPATPAKPKELIIDLNEEVANALGEEIKNTIVSAVKEKLAGEGAPAVTTTPEGKVQVEWYKLGKDILNTVNRFIEKLPVAAPPKGAVKEMPPPGKPPQLPTPPPGAITPTPTPAPPTPITQMPPIAPPTQTTPTPPQPEVHVSPPPTQEVATATKEEEKPTPQESKPEEPKPESPRLPGIKSEEATPHVEKLQSPEQPTTEVKPPKPSLKKNQEQKEAEKEKTISAEPTTQEVVVEQKTSESGGSEETPHGGSVTEKGRRKPTESD